MMMRRRMLLIAFNLLNMMATVQYTTIERAQTWTYILLDLLQLATLASRYILDKVSPLRMQIKW